MAAPSGAFAGLPARLQDDLRAIRNSYPRLEAHLLDILGNEGLDAKAKTAAVLRLFQAHQAYLDPRLVRFVRDALPTYLEQAERLLHGAPQRTISAQAQQAILARLRAEQLGPDQAAGQRVINALSQGVSGDELKALAYGYQRTDGSLVSLKAAGQARVRTMVNAMQAESQLARYRDAPDVSEVQFVAGGFCKYHGEGGTCTELDGTVFPVDAIPSWAQIPRHPYSNSRWLPVVNLPGVDTGGPDRKEPQTIQRETPRA